MSLYFRFFWLIFLAKRRTSLSPIDASLIELRVLPNDLDLNRHVNNGRYGTFMDLGRMDLIVRTGLLKLMRKQNWFPVVADMHLRFLRPLKIWQRFQLETQLLGWDERWFYFQQRFIREEKICTVGLIKVQIRHGRKRVETERVLKKIGYKNSSPKIPQSVQQWISAIDNHL
jgi:acyl-CoA thioesterase FadM